MSKTKIRLTTRGECVVSNTKTRTLPDNAKMFEPYFKKMIWDFDKLESIANTAHISQRGPKEKSYPQLQ